MCGVEPRRAVARGCIAAMLQKGGLMPGVKVVELVGFVRSLYADPLPLDRVLETAGLASVAGRQVDRLSGGQDPAGALRARTGGQPGGLWMPLAILPGSAPDDRPGSAHQPPRRLGLEDRRRARTNGGQRAYPRGMDGSPGGAGDLELPPGRDLRRAGR